MHHDALAKERKNADGLILNIDGLIVRLSGDERILEKGKNDTRVGVTETNVHTNDYSAVRPFAPAFMSHCLEQAKVENYTQTSQIEKIWKKMHETMYETVMEPAMRRRKHGAFQIARNCSFPWRNAENGDSKVFAVTKTGVLRGVFSKLDI